MRNSANLVCVEYEGLFANLSAKVRTKFLTPFLFLVLSYNEPPECNYEFEIFSGSFCHEIQILCLGMDGSLFAKHHVERFTSRSSKIGTWDQLNDSIVSIKLESKKDEGLYRYKNRSDLSLLIPMDQNWQTILFSVDSLIGSDSEIIELSNLILKANQDINHPTLIKLKSEVVARFFCERKIKAYTGGRTLHRTKY